MHASTVDDSEWSDANNVTYWPEEGTPDFASYDDGETWQPLCSHGHRMHHVNGVDINYRCNVDGERHLIWAEDWPDADPED